MRTLLVRVFVIAFLVLHVLSGSVFATIEYQANQIDGDEWEYNYVVVNDDYDFSISAVTLWFDTLLYADLQIKSSPQLSQDWDEAFLFLVEFQGDESTYFANGYDIFNETGDIAQGESVTGFSIGFKWLGVGEPESQPFDVINYPNYSSLYSGMTIPEPATVVFFIVGAMIFFGKRKKIIHPLSGK